MNEGEGGKERRGRDTEDGDDERVKARVAYGQNETEIINNSDKAKDEVKASNKPSTACPTG